MSIYELHCRKLYARVLRLYEHLLPQKKHYALQTHLPDCGLFVNPKLPHRIVEESCQTPVEVWDYAFPDLLSLSSGAPFDGEMR